MPIIKFVAFGSIKLERASKVCQNPPTISILVCSKNPLLQRDEPEDRGPCNITNSHNELIQGVEQSVPPDQQIDD
ncbi:9062_t:CDS:2 [Funneliformis caledonium]|uniref:9062_t:CDS:1 n=1 Tax=Funneliformis caledonium TaxID=1117310 RepID=A0A9N9ILT4_9GLOM|nr:9062_t:CDS:2 [Funneliformis caledonium]